MRMSDFQKDGADDTPCLDILLVDTVVALVLGLRD